MGAAVDGHEHAGQGAINAHTHLYSGLAPLGLPAPVPPPESFVEILERVWWRLDRALDADSLRASARLYVAEALLAGTTALIDHHESPSFIEGSLDVIADECQRMGMRAVLCYGATERNGGADEAARGLAECERFIGANQRPLVRGAVGLHASFTASDDTIRAAGALARRLGVAVHVHLAEDLADCDDARARGYAGPLQRLLALDALPRGSILAHGVHLTADEVRSCAGQGLWLVQNPRSNRGNRVGYPRHLAQSDRVALGTDGYPADMAAEAAALMAEASAAGDDIAAVVSARPGAGHKLIGEIFGAAAVTAAVAAAPGPSGDVITSVVIDGRSVVEGGALAPASGDLETIRAEAQREAARLFARMAAL